MLWAFNRKLKPEANMSEQEAEDQLRVPLLDLCVGLVDHVCATQTKGDVSAAIAAVLDEISEVLKFRLMPD